jgi:hypothetical protein
MHRGEFAWAASGDVAVHEYDDVLMLIGCMKEMGERGMWCKLCPRSGVNDVSALAKWRKCFVGG